MNHSLKELTGNHIRIIPMERGHIRGLWEAGGHQDIWTHLPQHIKTLQEMSQFVEDALTAKETGAEYPFVVIERKTGKIIGTTRFLAISQAHKSLEIGWTWFRPSVWGTPVNKECKHLLLRYCFHELGMIRVQFKTDDRNIRSQKAIERLGAVKEGTLRNHMIRRDGSYRHSVFYSIIASEWPAAEREFFGSLKV
ncbi:GNAT family protein [Domibacillus sp. DTU_2020_1001157_1_SI_ALB_TIR_016]|uniref:GNAT family N-acetyltransferase n=1 Tax=Domibacillus sp. DTU_2020_1001157_1_SI_ALB_TIR_016 TaxID=3077789 RepID=UPI0028E9C82E|nr:GNAT family protein [Domibacillus sp. DTU_2020_1001157_1_SI_ALB_TIR_016]WNS78217.1 GNAT family protein [Domibacillus sp. DTU_2020_1001157_1_SI_ALB_TIR_016]